MIRDSLARLEDKFTREASVLWRRLEDMSSLVERSATTNLICTETSALERAERLHKNILGALEATSVPTVPGTVVLPADTLPSDLQPMGKAAAMQVELDDLQASADVESTACKPFQFPYLNPLNLPSPADGNHEVPNGSRSDQGNIAYQMIYPRPPPASDQVVRAPPHELSPLQFLSAVANQLPQQACRPGSFSVPVAWQQAMRHVSPLVARPYGGGDSVPFYGQAVPGNSARAPPIRAPRAAPKAQFGDRVGSPGPNRSFVGGPGMSINLQRDQSDASSGVLAGVAAGGVPVGAGLQRGVPVPQHSGVSSISIGDSHPVPGSLGSVP